MAAKTKKEEQGNFYEVACMNKEDFLSVVNEFWIAESKFKDTTDLIRYMSAAHGKRDYKAFTAGFLIGRYVQKVQDVSRVGEALCRD